MIDQTTVSKLSEYGSENGSATEFDVEKIPGEIPTFSVAVDGREELPIYVSATEEEVLCICHLFGINEVKPETESEMNKVMLGMNIPMPLSSFGVNGDHYVVFGSLSAKSDIDELAHELVTLSNNSLDAIEALSEYLK